MDDTDLPTTHTATVDVTADGVILEDAPTGAPLPKVKAAAVAAVLAPALILLGGILGVDFEGLARELGTELTPAGLLALFTFAGGAASTIRAYFKRGR